MASSSSDDAWAATSAWSPLSITLLVMYLVFGAAFYTAAYSIGVYVRHLLAFALGAVTVAFAVDFDSQSMSKPLAIAIIIATGILCVVLVHFFRWARYLFIGTYVGMLLSLALPDLCAVSIMFGALAFPAGLVVGLLGVYYGYKSILTFSATLGAVWLLKGAAVVGLQVYRTHFLHRASGTLSAYFFPASDARLPPVPYFIPLALVLASLVLAVPRVVVGVIYHRHGKKSAAAGAGGGSGGGGGGSANASSSKKHSSSSPTLSPSQSQSQSSSGGLSPSQGGKRGLASGSSTQLGGAAGSNQTMQRSPSTSSLSIRKSGSSASMSSLSARQQQQRPK